VSAQTFDTRIGREFAKLVKQRTDDLTQAVMNGGFGEIQYRTETGRFNGLREALELYEEAESLAKAAERS
jgi:hypothetical protein